jgi:lysophospholipase L1-like esterase
MKTLLQMLVVSGLGWMAVTGGAQMAAPPVQAAPASASLEKELAAAQAKLMDWAALGRYAAENAALAAPAVGERRVVFYGDSITDAWGRRPGTGTFFPGKPYVNRGISGQTTAQMVVRFHPDVVDLHPAVVVILAGTNDVAQNTGPMTEEMTIDDFRAMTEIARANGIKVVVASILPAAEFWWHKGLEPAPKIRALNARLEAWVKSQGIVWVDYYSPMADASGAMKAGLSADGVHPNEAGYTIMAPLAEAGIKKALGK